MKREEVAMEGIKYKIKRSQITSHYIIKGHPRRTLCSVG